MPTPRWRRIVSFTIILGLVVVIAYFGGIKAAEGLQGWNAKRLRVKQTEAILKEMGTGLGVGKTLPDVVLADLEGIDTPLSSVLCDHSVIVYFKTDCSFSRAELGALKEVSMAPEDQRCFILISNSDQAELWDVKRKLGLSSLILYDRDAKYGKQLGIKSVPMNFMVDRTLRIEGVMSGLLLSEEIKDIMEHSGR